MSKKDLQMYFGCRIHEALFPDTIFSSGMGNVVVSRKTAGGAIIGVAFLCDHWCLGVKDCLLFFESEAEYRTMIAKFSEIETFSAVDPGYAKKYILDLIAWAKSIGFAPHSDYNFCREILAGIVPDSTATFEFGHNGAPMFMNGPDDTPERVKSIMKTLAAYQEKTGINTTHTLVGKSPSLLEKLTGKKMALPGNETIILPDKR